MGDTQNTALPPGTKIDEYEIRSVLGRGGFGITYLIRDTQLDKDCALKEYFPDDLVRREGSGVRFSSNPRSENDFNWGLKKFKDEARLIAQFKHPNIVGVHRVIEKNRTVYMVLDYIEGNTLEKWLTSLDSPPTQEEIDLIAAPLLSALELVHANRAFHLDFSPENVMIRSADGMPVLLDFGASRFEIKQHSQLVSALLFKSGYSAPEQYVFNADMFGPWTDIYAFGATLYRAITGKRPTEATARQMNDDYVPAAKATRGRYRDSFLSAIDWALKLQPKQRPQSINEWRQQVLKGSTVAPLNTRVAQREAAEKQYTAGGTMMLRPGDKAGATMFIPSGQTPKLGSFKIPGGNATIAGTAAFLLVSGAWLGHILSPGASINPLTYIFSAPTPPSAKPLWGAVVESASTRHVFARVKEPSQDVAQSSAMSKCTARYGAGDCRVIATLSDRECWAQAVLPSDETKQTTAKGATIQSARDVALSDCQRTLGGCLIAMTLCADGSNLYQK